MTQDEIEKILKRLEDNEKTMKRAKKFLSIVIALMVISLGVMVYLAYTYK